MGSQQGSFAVVRAALSLALVLLTLNEGAAEGERRDKEKLFVGGGGQGFGAYSHVFLSFFSGEVELEDRLEIPETQFWTRLVVSRLLDTTVLSGED